MGAVAQARSPFCLQRHQLLDRPASPTVRTGQPARKRRDGSWAPPAFALLCAAGGALSLDRERGSLSHNKVWRRERAHDASAGDPRARPGRGTAGRSAQTNDAPEPERRAGHFVGAVRAGAPSAAEGMFMLGCLFPITLARRPDEGFGRLLLLSAKRGARLATYAAFGFFFFFFFIIIMQRFTSPFMPLWLR